MLRRCALAVALTFTATSVLQADEIRVAVAANFAEPLAALTSVFEARSGHKITIVAGATGKLYTQILHGAPFDVFLAADAKHPQLIEAAGLGIMGSRFTYATGKLVLYSARENFGDMTGDALKAGKFNRLALANPDVAPYGQAAKEYLTRMNLWEKLQGRIVLGQDLGQTYQFVITQNAELGFIGLSQIYTPGKPVKGYYYLVPQDSYAPIRQQAIGLRSSRPVADFLLFLRSASAKKTIRTYGYEVD